MFYMRSSSDKNLISRKVVKYLIIFFLLQLIICSISIVRLGFLQNTLANEVIKNNDRQETVSILDIHEKEELYSMFTRVIIDYSIAITIIFCVGIIEILLTAHLATKETLAASSYRSNNSSSAELFSEFINSTENLTYTERLIFDQYLEGKSGKEVTETLGITMNTLKVHNNHIYKKLKISSKEELSLYIDLISKSGMLAEIIK